MRLQVSLIVVLFISMATSNAVAVESVVSVSEAINGRDDASVRQAARIRASLEGITRLPVVLKGQESLRDGKYNEHIKAIGVGYVNVETLSEDWDRQNGTLSLTAAVTLDEDKVRQTLESISESEYAKSQLKAMQAFIDKMLLKESLEKADIYGLDVLKRSVYVSPMVRMTIQETQESKYALINAMAKQLREKLEAVSASFKAQIVDAGKDGITVEIDGARLGEFDEIKREFAKALFTNDVTEKFYELHQKKVNELTGNLCLQSFKYQWLRTGEPVESKNYRQDEPEFIGEYASDPYIKDRIVLNVKTYLIAKNNWGEVNKVIKVKDQGPFPGMYYNIILSNPTEYLKLGVCI